MTNQYEKTTMLYHEAQEELIIAKNQYNHAHPSDSYAIDAAIYRLYAAEKSVDCLYKKLISLKEETLCTA